MMSNRPFAFNILTEKRENLKYLTDNNKTIIIIFLLPGFFIWHTIVQSCNKKILKISVKNFRPGRLDKIVPLRLCIKNLPAGFIFQQIILFSETDK